MFLTASTFIQNVTRQYNHTSKTFQFLIHHLEFNFINIIILFSIDNSETRLLSAISFEINSYITHFF